MTARMISADVTAMEAATFEELVRIEKLPPEHFRERHQKKIDAGAAESEEKP